MSNDLQLLRADNFEIADSSSVANLPKASKAGNRSIGSVNGNLYLTDEDGVSTPATRSEPVSSGTSKTLTEAEHAGKTILMDSSTGTTIILPPSTGNGAKYRFVTKVAPASGNDIIKVANASDTMAGVISVLSDDSAAVLGYKASGTDDTITLNRTTKGATSVGEWLEIEDIAENLFLVRGMLAATGTEASPFSATVS